LRWDENEGGGLAGRARALVLVGGIHAVLAWSARARAIDPFEIQVYDGTLNQPGVFGLEAHVNSVLDGVSSSEPPELPQDRQTHLTFEPALGLLRWWEVGAYLQTARRGDGTVTYAGTKLRSKFILPQTDSPWRFGVNVEVSRLPEAYDRDRWGGEIRPIMAFENRRWLLAFNPILDFSFSAAGLREGPSFEPALMAKHKIERLLAFGIEYYSSFGPLTAPVSGSEQMHYLFEAIDLLFLERVELNVGVGEGLTQASNAFVVKMILGYSWDLTSSSARISGRNP
jgi:hypothetical protein